MSDINKITHKKKVIREEFFFIGTRRALQTVQLILIITFLYVNKIRVSLRFYSVKIKLIVLCL